MQVGGQRLPLVDRRKEGVYLTESKILCSVSYSIVQEEGEPFYLIPEHVGIEGKDTGGLVDASTGNLIKTFCDGSFRPPLKENSVH